MAKRQKSGVREYADKRDFTRTPEPKGGVKKEGGGIFVLQKHSARALHYDLRLELNGVLKSWAVPRGPSLDPDDKRLAVHVEDHPIEYADFEGVIPKGEYGGGTVLIWDKGFWVPAGNPAEGYRKGALKFRLLGNKLRGGFALVRTGDRGEEGSRDNWLFIKEKDSDAKKGGGQIIEELPRSVVSGRDIEEIAAEPAVIERTAPAGVFNASKTASMPGFIEPQLAALVDAPPPGDDWLHEIKYDGYRILARLQDKEVRLFTRHANDWTSRFPAIARELENFPAEDAWLDGETVFLEEDGKTSFEGLQKALGAGTSEDLTYLIFDIMYYNGYDLTGVPLQNRKLLLGELLKSGDIDKKLLRYSEHVEGKGEEFFAKACALSLEGVVSKQKNSSYTPWRSWLKCKCHEREEFVIGGYTASGAGSGAFGALLIGFYNSAGRLIYAGRVGTGWDTGTRSGLWKRLQKLKTKAPPFFNPPRGTDVRGVSWVKPELVAEVAFSQMTEQGVLRMPSFKWLREDKPASEVVREVPGKAKPASTAKGVISPVRVAGVRITNPDRILYPDTGLTKKALAEYYERIAPLMLPHVSNRPLTLVRCPEGYDKECFFQKHSGANIPKGVKFLQVEEEGETAKLLTVDSVEGLIGLVQMGVLEIHSRGSRIGRIEYPDRITFDMDPDPSVSWMRLVEAALLLSEVFKEIGLVSFVKTTGGKGLHVALPLLPRHGWDEVKGFTKAVAEYIARGIPERFTSTMSKSKRPGRIFIDYMRNIRGATAIELYSTRARAGAPVSVPLRWDELTGGMRPDSFTVENLFKRIEGLDADPWADYMKVRQSITKEMKKKIGLK